MAIFLELVLLLLNIADADDLICFWVDSERPELRLQLNLFPLLLREQLLHGQLLAPHVLDPAHNFQLFFHHTVCCMRELVPVRMTLRTE